MSLGYAQVQESVVNAFLGYSSRVYTPPAGFEADWKGIVLTSRPPDSKRAGVLFPLNGGLWHVTLVGTGHDYPPTDEPGFIEFARTLRSPVLHDALADAKPVTSISGYRRTENQLRHFERMASFPDGFVVLGDAASAFNPVYGQGMSVAGLSALVLQEWLRQGGTSASFQKRLGRGRFDALAPGNQRGLPLPHDKGRATWRLDEADAPLHRPRDRCRHR